MLRLDGTTLWISIYSNQWAACSSWAEQMHCAAIIRWAAQDAPDRLGDNVRYNVTKSTVFWNTGIHVFRRQAWSYWLLDAKSYRPVKWSQDPEEKSLKDPTRKGNLHDSIYVKGSSPDGLCPVCTELDVCVLELNYWPIKQEEDLHIKTLVCITWKKKFLIPL